MASIRRRKTGYQVQIRRDNQTLCKTFKSRDDAERWARMEERRIDLGDSFPIDTPSLAAIIDRYETDVAPTLRREENCVGILAVMRREPWMKQAAHKVPAAKLAEYRDRRLTKCAPETVRRELGLLQTILRYARREWSIVIADTLLHVRKPPAGRHRTRRIEPDEARRLLSAFDQKFRDFVLLAIETGLRRGELCRIEVKDIDWQNGLMEVHQTKNGHPRTIPVPRQRP